MLKYFKNLDDIKKRLFKSVYSLMLLSVCMYIVTLLSIVVTAIDYKHLLISIRTIEKETLASERDYANYVGTIEENRLSQMGYQKVDASFVVRMDRDANFSLLYGQ